MSIFGSNQVITFHSDTVAKLNFSNKDDTEVVITNFIGRSK